MRRFWEDVIRPCCEAAGVRRIVEIGSNRGENTVKLVNYAVEKDGFVYSVDPAPQFDYGETFRGKEAYYSFLKTTSVDALSKLHDYDAVLIDGDHNYYTVYTELQLVLRNAEPFPIVFLHDVSWPYDRRDLYYDPDTIPPAWLNVYKVSGIDPDTNELSEQGFNHRRCNSVYYSNYHCGVLTAVEDFIGENKSRFRFTQIPIMSGLGILLDMEQAYPEALDSMLRTLTPSEPLTNLMRFSDKWYAKTHCRMEQNIEAYQRVKKQADEANNELTALRTDKEALQAENERLQQQLNEEQKKLMDADAHYQTQMEEKARAIGALQTENEGLRQQLDEEQKKLNDAGAHHRAQMKEKELEISTLQAKNERLRRQISEERKKLNGAEACHLAQAEEELEDKEYAWLEREKVQAESAGAAANNPLPSEAPDQAPDKTADTTPLEPSRFSGEELKRLHRSRVRFYTETERPLVSIIILNRNGLPHLRTLAASLEQARFYDRYELIVVDNGSTDGSVAFLKSRAQALGKPLRLIENETNESFSVANNQAAQRANGSFLLFMNNDIEVTDGWLDELLRTAMTEKQAGAVGAKLVYPEGVGGVNAGKDNLIQHRGIGFRRDKSFNLPYTRPVNLGNGEQAWPDDGKAQQIGAVTAAVLLVSKQAFESVGGFDEQYVYGYEDVDLCLKLLEKGYNNYYTPLAMLFHHEFGSQTEENQRSVEAIRAGNRYYFREKWQARLNTWLQLDRINGSRLFSEEALCVAFAVTEAGKNASAGDYFTAMELASSLEKRGYKIRYLCRRGPENWYDVGEDVDVLISMLDAYDLNRMYHIREDLVTVAWARNWFSRWIGNPSIQRYSLVLASSKTACDYMEQATGLKVTLFPIATNADRFRSVMNQPEKPGEKAKYGSDYVFTGSYWDAHREIMDCIEPEALPYKLRIFGKNWEKVPKFAEYTGGFLEYWKMPLVYKYTTLVVDDANHATVKFGAVNSRVFDALAVGRLVLTNGEKGAEETFGGMLPVFRSAREFKALTTFYMEHPADRESLIKRLQKFVLENHTYDIRANTLLRLIVDQRPADIPPAKKIAIMTPVRKWSEAEAWGDFHFAVAMKKCFEKKGYRAEIRILPEWEKEFDGKYVIVLRGLSVYHPKKEHVNLMWNISHPDEVTPEEYNQYDAVFVSSLIWAEHLRPRLKVPVYPLLQCTDPGVFNGPKYGDGEKRYELLFVGNSRKELRPILKDLIPTPYDLAVYGNYWHNRIDERYIRGEIIPNHKLGREYHDATILLNDHWEDMKDKGFISNRIFDGLAAGAFIITDDVAGLSDVLKDCVGVYHNREELAEKVKYYMEHPEERAEMAERGMALVRKNHTFRARVDEMLRVMETCDNKPLKG